MPIPRRHWLRSAGLALLLAAGMSHAGELATLPFGDGAGPTVLLVRHAEKATPPAGPRSADPPLAVAGVARAAALAALLADVPLAAVYASQFRRTQDTARPAALAHGLVVRVRPITGDVDAHARQLAAELRTRHRAGEVVLVVGHSNTLPALAQALGSPIAPIDESQYRQLHALGLGADGVDWVRQLDYGAP